MPHVSVVIPVYNAAEFLPRTLGDLRAQTLEDFEVICVDDGSSDRSAAVIAEHVARDPRFRLITQANAGSTVARNRGIDEARGEYVLFVDADDAFDQDLLSAASAQLVSTGADICLYNGTVLREEDQTAAPSYLRHMLLPETETFRPEDAAVNLFQLVTPAVWLRMFRRSFLADADLRFTPGQIPDDLRFTAESLAVARSITILDRVLVHYRVGHAGAATSRWDQHPLAFEDALDDLGARLRAGGLLDRFDHSYRVLCLDAISHVLHRLVTETARELLLEELDTRLMTKYGLDTLRPGSVALGHLRTDLKELQQRTRPAAPAEGLLRRGLRIARNRLRRRRRPAP